MKKQKTIKEFHFKEADITERLDTTLPINLKHLEGLIEKIHKRYPLIDKSQVSVIVKAAFEAIRELLVSGCILNFNKFLFDTKLFFFKHASSPSLKIKLTTPPPIKKQNDR